MWSGDVPQEGALERSQTCLESSRGEVAGASDGGGKGGLAREACQGTERLLDDIYPGEASGTADDDSGWLFACLL